MKAKLPLLTIFLSFLLVTATFAQSGNNCEIMHEGNFTYGDVGDLVRVNINGKKHIEYHDNGKYYIKSKVKWVSDCEYTMTIKKITIPDFPFGKGDEMNVRINEVDGNTIYLTSTVKGQSFPGIFTKTD